MKKLVWIVFMLLCTGLVFAKSDVDNSGIIRSVTITTLEPGASSYVDLNSPKAYVGDIISFHSSVSGTANPIYEWVVTHDYVVCSNPDVCDYNEANINSENIGEIIFYEEGYFRVNLTVTDENGVVGRDTAHVNIDAFHPPTVEITYPASGLGWGADEGINFLTDASDLDGDSLWYVWDFGDASVNAAFLSEINSANPFAIRYNPDPLESTSYIVNVTVYDRDPATNNPDMLNASALTTIDIHVPVELALSCYLKTTGECNPADNEVEVLRISNNSEEFTYYDSSTGQMVTVPVEWINTHVYPPLSISEIGINYTPVCCIGEGLSVNTNAQASFLTYFPTSYGLSSLLATSGAHSDTSHAPVFQTLGLDISNPTVALTCVDRISYRPRNASCLANPTPENCCEDVTDYYDGPRCNCQWDSDGEVFITDRVGVLDCGFENGDYSFSVPANQDSGIVCADVSEPGSNFPMSCGNDCDTDYCGVIYEPIPSFPDYPYDGCDGRACLYSYYDPDGFGLGNHVGECGVYPTEKCCAMSEDCANNVNDDPYDNSWTDAADFETCYFPTPKGCGISDPTKYAECQFGVEGSETPLEIIELPDVAYDVVDGFTVTDFATGCWMSFDSNGGTSQGSILEGGTCDEVTIDSFFTGNVLVDLNDETDDESRNSVLERIYRCSNFYCSAGNNADQPLPAYNTQSVVESRHVCMSGQYWDPTLPGCREENPCYNPLNPTEFECIFNPYIQMDEFMGDINNQVYKDCFDETATYYDPTTGSPVMGVCCSEFRYNEHTFEHIPVEIYYV